jgi:glycosyltransferase involved in cell wall biosynthesis
MRLLFVHDHRFLIGSGGAVFTVGSFPRTVWSRYLAWFDEIVVVARDGGPAPAGSDLARSDLPQVRFNLVRNFPPAERLLGVRGAASAVIEREMRETDAVLVRLPSDLGNLAGRLAKRHGVVWAGEIVGCALDGYRNHGSRLSRAYAPLAMRRLRRLAWDGDQMLYVTRRFLQDRYPSLGDTVGVSDVELAPLDPAACAARQGRLQRVGAGQPPVFGTVASLRIMSKGVQDALAAVARLRARGTHIRYRVLGAGDSRPWRDRAAALGIAGLVEFDGTRPAGQGVRSWLDEIDVHLQPSYQEGLPRSTVEAMSRGCACLGSTAGGLPELLPPHRTHAPGDIAALAALIELYAARSDLVASASAEDLATSLDYSAEALEAPRAAFYRRLADRAARA